MIVVFRVVIFVLLAADVVLVWYWHREAVRARIAFNHALWELSVYRKACEQLGVEWTKLHVVHLVTINELNAFRKVVEAWNASRVSSSRPS